MKPFLVISSLLLTSSLGFTQEFAFELIFKDAIGNADTLIVGYDNSATSGIDTVFGESNIISDPVNSTFDVRFSDVLLNGTYTPTYQSKKQIVTNECPNWLLSDFGISIDIHSNNYPVTVKWNSTLFADTCRIGTILTDVAPGGWFDTGGTFRTFLEQKDSIVINFPHYDYINNQSQTIGVMWIAFMDSSVFEIPFDPIIFTTWWLSLIEEDNSISNPLIVYPNPVENNLVVQYPEETATLEIYDTQGKIIYSQSDFEKSEIDLSFLDMGIYLLRIRSDNGASVTRKLVKN